MSRLACTSLACTASNIRLAMAVYAPAPADMFCQASWMYEYHVLVELMPKFKSIYMQHNPTETNIISTGNSTSFSTIYTLFSVIIKV